MRQSWLADLLVGEGSIKSLVALAKAVCDVPGKTAELLSAQVRPYHHLPQLPTGWLQVSETMFMLSFKDEMKFDLIQHGGIPVLGVVRTCLLYRLFTFRFFAQWPVICIRVRVRHHLNAMHTSF